MQIQDFNTIENTPNFKIKNLKFEIVEALTASLIFLLPILVLFALSVNQ